jgi:hypothetical protein
MNIRTLTLDPNLQRVQVGKKICASKNKRYSSKYMDIVLKQWIWSYKPNRNSEQRNVSWCATVIPGTSRIWNRGCFPPSTVITEVNLTYSLVHLEPQDLGQFILKRWTYLTFWETLKLGSCLVKQKTDATVWGIRTKSVILPLYIHKRLSYNLNPCGGGVEYLHRDPASRKRQRNGDKKGRAIA